MVLCFNYCLCQVRPLGWLTVIVDLILLKNRNFRAQENNFHNSQKRDFDLIFLHKIGIQIYQVVLSFQNFWSYRSIRSIQIATDCSVFDRFCFLCVVCLFWWIYGQYRGVWTMEKLEYNRYYTNINKEWVHNNTKSGDLFSYTNGAYEIFDWVLCCEVFKFWIRIWWTME